LGPICFKPRYIGGVIPCFVGMTCSYFYQYHIAGYNLYISKTLERTSVGWFSFFKSITCWFPFLYKVLRIGLVFGFFFFFFFFWVCENQPRYKVLIFFIFIWFIGIQVITNAITHGFHIWFSQFDYQILIC
jgi:hypothetical protein